MYFQSSQVQFCHSWIFDILEGCKRLCPQRRFVFAEYPILHQIYLRREEWIQSFKCFLHNSMDVWKVSDAFATTAIFISCLNLFNIYKLFCSLKTPPEKAEALMFSWRFTLKLKATSVTTPRWRISTSILPLITTF